MLADVQTTRGTAISMYCEKPNIDHPPKNMRLRILSSLLLLVICFDAAAGDLYATINQLRDGEGECDVKHLAPLQAQAALERAARDLARGSSLDQSLNAAGYRATRARFVKFSGKGIGSQIAGLMDEPRHCQQWQDAAVTEIGIYQDARQVWVVLAAPFAPSVAMDEESAGQRVLELVNQARRSPRNCGNKAFNAARPLRWNDALAKAARWHAEDMARFDFLSHSGRNGSTAAQRVERAGYRYLALGENVAGGQMKPEDVVADWINSPGHCANLMNPAFSEMGVAFAIDRKSRMGVYWAQEFGAPR